MDEQKQQLSQPCPGQFTDLMSTEVRNVTAV